MLSYNFCYDSMLAHVLVAAAVGG